MIFGGVAGKLALLREQMKKKPCPRCGLHYDPKQQEQCPHCGDLDQRGLEALLAQREIEHAGNKQLGSLFLYIALTLFVLILLLLLAY